MQSSIRLASVATSEFLPCICLPRGPYHATVDPPREAEADDGLLYQDLIRREAFGPDGRLPPVLPVVLYNGRPRWTAPVEMADLIAPAKEALACFQPSQRYFLLDEGRCGEDDLPRRNLVSALVALENSGSAEDLWKVLAALSDWLRSPEDDELRRAFAEWVRWMAPRRYGEAAPPVAQAMEGGGAMLAERMKEWTEEWLQEGLERGRTEERALLCRLAARKFDAVTAERLSGLLDRLTDPEHLAEVGDWIIECGTGAELLARAERIGHPS